jgi:hypothetical protein
LVARGFVRGNIFGVIFATLTFVFMSSVNFFL